MYPLTISLACPKIWTGQDRQQPFLRVAVAYFLITFSCRHFLAPDGVRQGTWACHACGAVLSREGKYPKFPGTCGSRTPGFPSTGFRKTVGAGGGQDTAQTPARCRSLWINRRADPWLRPRLGCAIAGCGGRGRPLKLSRHGSERQARFHPEDHRPISPRQSGSGRGWNRYPVLLPRRI